MADVDSEIVDENQNIVCNPSPGRCRRCACSKEHCYSQVVVIGNGPSGICLSYLLSGNWPWFTGEPHPDPYLQVKLREDVSIIEQDLDYLSGGLEGRSRNSVALLFDTLHQPNADLGDEEKSRLEWRHHETKAIQHVVLGKGQPGGSWGEMDGSVLTLSLGKWMELPGVIFQDWIKEYRERRISMQTSIKADTAEPMALDRATLGEVAKYYKEYVKLTKIKEHSMPRTKVTSVRRLKGKRVINCESGEPEIPCPGCQKFEGDNLFEIKGVQLDPQCCSCQGQEFTMLSSNVVMATGMLGIPNRLHVDGESLPYVSNGLKDLDTAVQQMEVHPNSDPILVVGAGLSAADAVMCALKQNIPVVHVFRRRADDPKLIYGQLPRSVYPEYHQMIVMMKESSSDLGSYKSYPENSVVRFNPDRTVVLKGSDGTHWECKVSLAIICIGNRPNLSFLPNEGRHLGANEGQPISSRDNPIDVNPFTMESTAEPGLFALGPLVGDNFVRFAQGGCLALTRHLAKKNGWVQDTPAGEEDDEGSEDEDYEE